MSGIVAGVTATGIPAGQTRRQTFVVTAVHDGIVVGLLVSRKHPGDYRGGVVAYTEDVTVTDTDCPATGTPVADCPNPDHVDCYTAARRANLAALMPPARSAARA